MMTTPARINNHAKVDEGKVGSNSLGEVAIAARAYPIAHTGMPTTFLKIMLASLPPRSPKRREKRLVKALAELNIKPRRRGIRNKNIKSSL
jgi:hypothetical protein